jgi:RNA recognition motif-containing protein
MALLKNGISYMGRILIVEGVEKKSSEEQEKEGNKNKSPSEKQKCSIETPTLFIGGLSNSSNVDSLKNFFATVGAVQNVRIIVEK